MSDDDYVDVEKWALLAENELKQYGLPPEAVTIDDDPDDENVDCMLIVAFEIDGQKFGYEYAIGEDVSTEIPDESIHHTTRSMVEVILQEAVDADPVSL